MRAKIVYIKPVSRALANIFSLFLFAVKAAPVIVSSMNAKVTVDLQRHIQRWMDEHQATMSDLARALGVSQPGVSRWLRKSAVGTKIQSHIIMSMRHLGMLPADAVKEHGVTYPAGSTLPAREFRDAQADPLFRRIEACWPKMPAEDQLYIARRCAEILERDQARMPAQAAGGAAVGLQEKAQRQPTEEKAVPNAPPTSATALAPKPAPASRAGARPRQPARSPAPGGAVPPG